MSGDDVFQRARDRAAISDVAGVTLYRSGNRLRGECPLCGASKGKKAAGAFSVGRPDPKGAEIFFCHACEATGDVVTLESRLTGKSLREAAEYLAGAEFVPVAAKAPEPRPSAGPSRLAETLWRESVPARRTLVETYLRRRRLDGPVLLAALEHLRFHPSAFWTAGDAIAHMPAMIARPETADGPTGGVHCTYLDGVGRRTARSPAKLMFGPQNDAAGRPGGVWLSARIAMGPLVVGEGIETSLSAAQLLGRPCRVAAALSLNRLSGGALKDRWGRMDPDAVTADPARPAFTWPEVGEVLIAVDRDMAPVKIKTRKRWGGTTAREISGETRARISAGLGVQAWRAAGANAVRAIAPAAGRDFGDELMAEVG